MRYFYSSMLQRQGSPHNVLPGSLVEFSSQKVVLYQLLDRTELDTYTVAWSFIDGLAFCMHVVFKKSISMLYLWCLGLLGIFELICRKGLRKTR